MGVLTYLILVNTERTFDVDFTGTDERERKAEAPGSGSAVEKQDHKAKASAVDGGVAMAALELVGASTNLQGVDGDDDVAT